MANHPNRAKRYKVWPVPGGSDDEGITWFAVKGPDVEYFARMDELAEVMQQALNGRTFKARERKVIREALQAALAGEWSEGDLCWSQADTGAARSLLERL